MIYTNNLIESPLNEMYYGKHPLFHEIEEDIFKLQELIGRNFDNRMKKVNESYKSNISKFSKLFKKPKNKEELQEEQMKNALLNAIISSEHNNKQLPPSSKTKILKMIAKAIAFVATPFVPFISKYMRKNPDEIRNLKKMSYRNDYDSNGYFIPDENDKMEYITLMNNIMYNIKKVFGFPYVTFDILDNGEGHIKNACMIELDNLVELQGMTNMIKNASNKIPLQNYMDKLKLNKVSSNQDSIFFKNFNKEHYLILITTSELLARQSREILATLLHEIGHAFAYALLPIKLLNGTDYFQEIFADAFATKFGYGLELTVPLYRNELEYVFASKSTVLMDYLKQMQLTADEYNITYKLPDYIKAKLIYNQAVSYYLKNESHPRDKDRFFDQFKHLQIEVGNPRLSERQKRELTLNINRYQDNIIGIKNYFVDQIPAHYEDIKSIENTIDNSPYVSANKTKVQNNLNPVIIRDILDKVYDMCMNNANN